MSNLLSTQITYSKYKMYYKQTTEAIEKYTE